MHDSLKTHVNCFHLAVKLYVTPCYFKNTSYFLIAHSLHIFYIIMIIMTVSIFSPITKKSFRYKMK